MERSLTHKYLSSVLVNSLLKLPGNVGVAFIYCSSYSQAVHTADVTIGSLVRQLAAKKMRQGDLPKAIEAFNDKVGPESKPSF